MPEFNSRRGEWSLSNREYNTSNEWRSPCQKWKKKEMEKDKKTITNCCSCHCNKWLRHESASTYTYMQTSECSIKLRLFFCWKTSLSLFWGFFFRFLWFFPLHLISVFVAVYVRLSFSFFRSSYYFMSVWFLICNGEIMKRWRENLFAYLICFLTGLHHYHQS